MRFKDRVDAGQKLAQRLGYLRNQRLVILAIPRGGVVVGDVIAKSLGLPLDVVVPRKIGSPYNPELAIGAVMHDGSFFPNDEVIKYQNVTKSYIDEQIAKELEEIERRLALFRGRKDYDLKNKTIILVDDGIATGSTILAALEWLKKQEPNKIILAVPLGSKGLIERLSKTIEVISIQTPESFNAVGEFYDFFDQVEDSEVIKIMQSYGFESTEFT